MATHTGGLVLDQAVEVRDLVRKYGERAVLDGVDLSIRPGEFVALLGKSGSGKSTLLRALAGLDYDVDGSGDLAVPGNVSVVFQDSRLLPWARVLDNVVLGLRNAHERGRQSLDEVGLAGREQAWPNELSGGEQQRVALARSLVREPAAAARGRAVRRAGRVDPAEDARAASQTLRRASARSTAGHT